MADGYLLETGTDRILLEDGTGIDVLDTYQTFSTTLGTVTDTGTGSTPTGWDSSRALTITTPETTGNDATVQIALKNITAGTGLIVFHEGSNLPGWWDDGLGGQTNFIAALAANGYRMIQVKGIANYWMNAPLSSDLGTVLVAKRPAALIKYLHDTYSDGLPFIFAGSSAGSSALAYAMVHLGQAPIIDHAIHCAAVPHADLFRVCAHAIGDESFWGGTVASADLVDIAHGYAGVGTGPCALGDASTEGPMWGATSLVNMATASYQWPWCRVDILTGSLDYFKPQGILYHNQLTAAGQPHQLGILPNTVHVMKDTDKGQQTIVAAIRRKPRIGAWGELTAETGTSLTITLDQAPAVGDLLVAVRHWNGIASVGTTPAGWTRVSVASTSGGSTRTVAIECKTSDGTEGTSLAFATTGSAVQSVAAAVVIDANGMQLAKQTAQTSTAATMTLTTTTAVDVDSISFAGVVVEETGNNNFNEAWTNDFDQFSSPSEVFSSAYAIHATTGIKTTTETWTVSNPAAGVVATFAPIRTTERPRPVARPRSSTY